MTSAPPVDPIVETSVASARARTPASWFRADVDGLRAIAILLVVGYHATIRGFRGGFIGVDVFFVISGFLISRNLLKETRQSERVGLLGFWARRMRRLVPALALVLVVTLVAGMFILPLYQQADVAKQGGAAALYISNMLFAVQANSYFAADVGASPFLHTWSLGVEEQFYLIWPLLFAFSCIKPLDTWTRRTPASRRRLLIGIFTVVGVSSFALSVALTRSGSNWAFFGLPSRAWEFAVAGLLAAVTVPDALRRVAVRTAMAVAGLVVLGVAVVVIDDTLPYPGLWALLPVGATVLLIVAGETWGGEVAATPISAVLATRPAQWLGRVSYSWYLWHWPAIVLAVVAFDSDSVRVRSVAAIATLPVAWLAYKYFETPIRFTPLIARSNLRTFGFAGAVTIAVVALAVIIRPETVVIDPSAKLVAADLEAPPGSPLDQRVDFAVAEYLRRNESDCPTEQAQTADLDTYCELGDPNGARTVLVLGDSHTGQWRRPLDQVADEQGIRLLVRQHNGCPPYPVPITVPKKADDPGLCASVARSDQRIIDRLKPDAVLIAAWSGNISNIHESLTGGRPDPAEQARLWEEGVRTMLTDLKAKGIAVGLILDEPTLPADPKKCLAAEGEIDRCEVARDKATIIAGPLLEAEHRIVKELDLASLDMTDVVCDTETCHLEIDGTLVYIDAHHLTDAFTAKQMPRLTTLLQDLIAKIPSS